MSRAEIEGLEIEFELLGGSGRRAVAITPGGRFSKDSAGIHAFGEALAGQGFRVLLWDRPNCGASDLCFEGEGESRVQARVLTGLIRTLDLGPAVIAGGSAGARTSIFAALHDPEAVSHLVLWWISGGIVSLMMLGASYCCESAAAASMGGMAAVAAMPAWAEQLERNPRNRDILLRQEPWEFIARMERWAAGFVPSPDSPIVGMTDADFAKLTMPTMVVRGSPTDIFHPAYICEQVHARIAGAILVDAPWPDDVFARRMLAGEGHFLDWPLLAPRIAAFAAES